MNHLGKSKIKRYISSYTIRYIKYSSDKNYRPCWIIRKYLGVYIPIEVIDKHMWKSRIVKSLINTEYETEASAVRFTRFRDLIFLTLHNFRGRKNEKVK